MQDKEPSRFGRRLRELRKKADITTYALARRASQVVLEDDDGDRGPMIVARNLDRIESGKVRDPNLSTAVRLALALGVSLDEMIPGKKFPEKPQE